MIHRQGKQWVVSFFCLLGHRHRLRALDEAGNPVTDRKGAERAYYRAAGGPCPVEERRRRREQVEAEQAEAAQRVLELKRFETVATEYLTWAGQSRPRSLMFREKALKHLETAFKGRVLGAIEEQDVEAYVVRRKDAGAAPGTVNRERAVLSHLFTKAIAWKYVSRNPVKGTEPLKEPNEKPRPLSFDEEAALFKVLPAHYKPFVTLALHTGLRLGELPSPGVAGHRPSWGRPARHTTKIGADRDDPAEHDGPVALEGAGADCPRCLS